MAKDKKLTSRELFGQDRQVDLQVEVFKKWMQKTGDWAELASEMADELPPELQKALLEELKAREESGAPALPSTQKIVLSAAEMQQELDARVGKSFGSIEANKAEINLVKALLRASRLQLLYEGQPANLLLAVGPGSREGTFQVVTAGANRRQLVASSTWPKLSVTQRTSE
jgi:hypothetical protein